MAKALFLDRDGVINIENKGGYILLKEKFFFYDGAIDSIVKAANHFKYIFIVTNQRGVGRGLMSQEQLDDIHDYMMKKIEAAGGKIDKIYCATSIEDDHPLRKPNVGMALKAKKDFPDVSFKESVMIGNNISDMQFGKSMEMETIFLYSTSPKFDIPHPLIDKQYESLEKWIQSYR